MKTKENQIFNNLKTIRKEYRENKVTYWRFECLLCGNEHVTIMQDVRRGKIKSCGCQKNSKSNNGNWLGYKELSGRVYGHYKYNAIKRGIKWDITIEDMWNAYIQQNKKCAYTDIELFLEPKTIRNRTGINCSLDRINSNKGYIKGNIQWVYKSINIVKNTLEHKEFIFLCKKIADKFSLEDT
jgi:hypothetical protein